jgi:hypothetical protein
VEHAGLRLTREKTRSGFGTIGGEMPLKYPQLGEGQPILIRLNEPFYSCCCDCALVHKEVYDLAIYDGEVMLEVRHWRDNRRTGQKRRYKGVIYDDRRKDDEKVRDGG